MSVKMFNLFLCYNGRFLRFKWLWTWHYSQRIGDETCHIRGSDWIWIFAHCHLTSVLPIISGETWNLPPRYDQKTTLKKQDNRRLTRLFKRDRNTTLPQNTVKFNCFKIKKCWLANSSTDRHWYELSESQT